MRDLLAEYERVTRRTPCPVCGKPDWCLIARDRNSAICKRSCEGSECQVGEAGYKYLLSAGEDRPSRQTSFVITRREEKRRDFSDMAMLLKQAATNDIVRDSAERLGVSAKSLRTLGVGYHRLAGSLAFPMYDREGFCGIRLRRIADGFKYAMLGSKNGVFVSPPRGTGFQCIIVEGPTDAAAALTMGFEAVIGRPFCKGGNAIIAEMLADWEPSRVIIVADGDDAGREGAEQLANELCSAHPVHVIEPGDGAKDLRTWLRLGATSGTVGDFADSAGLWRPQ